MATQDFNNESNQTPSNQKALNKMIDKKEYKEALEFSKKLLSSEDNEDYLEEMYENALLHCTFSLPAEEGHAFLKNELEKAHMMGLSEDVCNSIWSNYGCATIWANYQKGIKAIEDAYASKSKAGHRLENEHW